jgi:hypothetical protein
MNFLTIFRIIEVVSKVPSGILTPKSPGLASLKLREDEGGLIDLQIFASHLWGVWG